MVSSIVLFLTYPNEEKKYNVKTFKEKISLLIKNFFIYIPNIKFVISHYSILIFVSSLLWAISTILVQQSINYSIYVFDFSKSSTEAISLL